MRKSWESHEKVITLLQLQTLQKRLFCRCSEMVCQSGSEVLNGWPYDFHAKAMVKKSRIRETSNLSTDADSSTDTTIG